MAQVGIHLSDPSSCIGPSGIYAHVLVTVVDVMVHQSASAGANDAGWVDLTPNLRQNPKQIDLLNTSTTQCLLSNLGAGTLPAGHYQQIRIILAQTVQPVGGSGGSGVISGQCPAIGNCVILQDGSVHVLQLSSEAQTGIKISSGQIAGGAFIVQPGQNVDLNLTFDACASITQTGSGGYLLNPTIQAVEVQPTTNCP